MQGNLPDEKENRMKYSKSIILLIVAAMVLTVFVGCSKQTAPTEPADTTAKASDTVA